MTSAVINTWNAANVKAADTISRTAALVKACSKDPEITPEASAIANAALTAATEAFTKLQEFKAIAGIS